MVNRFLHDDIFFKNTTVLFIRFKMFLQCNHPIYYTMIEMKINAGIGDNMKIILRHKKTDS